MPILHLKVTDHANELIQSQIDNGNYETADAIVEDLLHSLEWDRSLNQDQIAFLTQAIREGDESGVAEDGVYERVLGRLGLDPKK